MEPYAGAWSADEPILDFSCLTAPAARQRGRADQRAESSRAHAAGPESAPLAWNPLAGVGSTATADAQSAAAALFVVPVAWTEDRLPVAMVLRPDLTALSATQTAAPFDATHPDHAIEITAPATAATAAQAHLTAPESTATAPSTAKAVAALTSPAHVSPRIEPHAVASLPSMSTVTLRAADETPASVTVAVTGQAYTSMTTTYGADGSVVSIDLYGFARTFDHVRLDYRPDGTVETRTLFDTENPSAAIIIDYNHAGDAIARHEINLPDRPYARVDILYDADGAVAERTRSGFANGDLASITVRFDGHGAITSVEHLQLDGSRTLIGTSASNTLAGHGGDLLDGRGGADTFVLLDAGHQPMAIADFHAAQGDRLDLSHLLAGGAAHFLADAAFDGHAGAVRFDQVEAGVLVSIDTDGDTIGDASVLLAGAHAVTPPDIIL